jgi:hypothetical protein
MPGSWKPAAADRRPAARCAVEIRELSAPLFLKVAFEGARLWRSFDGLPIGADDNPRLNNSVAGVVLDMLARLRPLAARTCPRRTQLELSRGGGTGSRTTMLRAVRGRSGDARPTRPTPESPRTDALPSSSGRGSISTRTLSRRVHGRPHQRSSPSTIVWFARWSRSATLGRRRSAGATPPPALPEQTWFGRAAERRPNHRKSN